MKLKTRKSVAKRMRVSGTKSNRSGRRASIVRKAAGQSHFNSRERSKTTVNKRRSRNVKATDHKNVMRQLPYA